MKILALDIETSPNTVYTWGLFNQNIGLNQIVDTSRMLCFAAKFLGEPARAMRFHSEFKDGDHGMVEAAWALLDEADAVIHYNGRRFDIPHLNREFLVWGMGPPSPFQEIDLYLTAKRMFRFQSNRLQHVSEQLGLDGKVSHEGFDLWKKCLAGDPKAWKRMEKYNRQDVVLLEEAYEILQPWIPNHPNRALHDGLTHACPRCSSTRLQRRGSSFTKVSEFQRWQCLDCGGYSRSTKRTRGVGTTDVIAA